MKTTVTSEQTTISPQLNVLRYISCTFQDEILLKAIYLLISSCVSIPKPILCLVFESQSVRAKNLNLSKAVWRLAKITSMKNGSWMFLIIFDLTRNVTGSTTFQRTDQKPNFQLTYIYRSAYNPASTFSVKHLIEVGLFFL